MVWLQKELKDEQVDLDKSRIELYEFMNKYGILSVDEKRGTKLDEELKLLGEKVRTAKENTAALKPCNPSPSLPFPTPMPSK